jgi:hypothetical protein
MAALLLTLATLFQAPRSPNVDAQRVAMRKLSFLAGKWSGEACFFGGTGAAAEIAQSEDAQSKLDGLLLTVEGVGRNKSNGRLEVQAFAVIFYDDAAGKYRMRATNDGRWLETEITVNESTKTITWGFSLGDAKTNSTLRINEKGEWTELTELTLGSQPPRKYMEVTVRPSLDAPYVAVAAARVKSGATFIYSGSGFTPNRSVLSYLRRPDGREYNPLRIRTNERGEFFHKIDTTMLEVGTFELWAEDEGSHVMSRG